MMGKRIKKLLVFVLALMLISYDLAAIAEELATLVLPDNLKVIDEEVFYGDTSLGKVVVPEGATQIGSKAFAQSSLEEIALPDSVQSISSDAFAGLSDLTISASEDSYAYKWAVEQGYISFENPVDFEYVISDGKCTITEYIGTAAQVVIPSKIEEAPVISIGDSAFEGCTSLTSIVIPEGVTTIGDFAFDDCVSLTSVILPKGLTSIGNDAFDLCVNLTSITIPEGVTTIGEDAFFECYNLESITLPNSLTTIGNNAFAYCNSLTSVTLPENLTEIKDCMFLSCYNLASVTIPNGITVIGAWAFEGCGSLTSIKLPVSLNTIEEGAFNGCDGLTSIVIPECVTTIGDTAFAYCDTLTSITLPDNLTTIGDSAFEYCESLESITIPKNVTALGKEVFGSCSSLKEINVASSNSTYTSVDGVVFTKAKDTLVCYPAGKEVERYYIPQGVKTIAGGAFTWRTGDLLSIVLPEGLERIEEGAFGTRFYYVYIPETVTYIGEYNNSPMAYYGKSGSYAEEYAAEHDITFYTDAMPDVYVTPAKEFEYVIVDGECTIESFYDEDTTAVFIPDTIEGVPVTAIGSQAFYECLSLWRIYIPKTVTSIEPDAFVGSPIGRVEVDEENPVYKSLNGSLYTKDLKTLLFAGSADFVAIPEGVTAIGTGAFYCWGNLEEITIPESVTYIGDHAFNWCDDLKKVSIPKSVTYIGDYAFHWCLKLEEVKIPENVTYIGEGAFVDCALKSIHIPASVSEIGSYAFAYCKDLSEISVAEGNAHYVVVDGVLFTKDMKTLLLYPSGGDEQSYIVPDGVETIVRDAFLVDCTALNSVTFPESVTAIEEDAFIYYDWNNEDGEFNFFAPAGSYAYTWAEEEGYNIYPTN